MTDKLKYIHTHGKVKRCWHEFPTNYLLPHKCIICSKFIFQPNPTATLDYLVQRCEEEGFSGIGMDFISHKGGKFYTVGLGHKFSGMADTPQEALLTALVRALGWEGE